MPKNILMIGPTGVGKTEVARRLAKLAGAPFIKVISNLSLSLSLSLSFSCFFVFLEIPSAPSSCPCPSPSSTPHPPSLSFPFKSFSENAIIHIFAANTGGGYKVHGSWIPRQGEIPKEEAGCLAKNSYLPPRVDRMMDGGREGEGENIGTLCGQRLSRVTLFPSMPFSRTSTRSLMTL